MKDTKRFELQSYGWLVLLFTALSCGGNMGWVHGADKGDSTDCSSCHQQLSKKHPVIPTLRSLSNDNLRKAHP